METRSDGELVRAVLAGDVEAFAQLIRRERDSHTRFAVRMLGSRDDAEDALQLAFVRAYRSLSQCNEPDRFGAWLRRIVINECRTYATRRTKRERRFAYDEAALHRVVVNHPADQAGSTEDIHRALSQLSPEQREAFLLKYVEEMSYEQMQELTGVGESALKMRVKRACERLRELLQGATR